MSAPVHSAPSQSPRGLSRRRLLGASLGGVSLAVALPVLEIFLEDFRSTAVHGSNGYPLRFGTWFFANGVTPGRWTPEGEGLSWHPPAELAPVASVREHTNILSGYGVLLDQEPNLMHRTGVAAALTGTATIPNWQQQPNKTLHERIGAAPGSARSDGQQMPVLRVSATGDPRDCLHTILGHPVTQSMHCPLALYERLFCSSSLNCAAGRNSLVERALHDSVLSSNGEQRRRLLRRVGASDGARLDEYFTRLRGIEKRLAAACATRQLIAGVNAQGSVDVHSVAPDRISARLVEHVAQRHQLLAELLGLALATDQMRVFEMVFSGHVAGLHMSSDTPSHHALTHIETPDQHLGYRVRASQLVRATMGAWADFVQVLADIPEGDGCLLDNCLVLALSDSGDASTHSIRDLPFMTAGRAGGRLRSGLHVRGRGATCSEIGLTLQRAAGLSTAAWGAGPNRARAGIPELLS